MAAAKKYSDAKKNMMNYLFFKNKCYYFRRNNYFF